MGKDDFEYKPLFESIFMLTRAFGIDISPYLKKTSKAAIENVGPEKAHSLIISITMDETFIFCYSWLILKLFENYPENNCKIGHDFFMNSSIDFMAHYSFNALNDEKRKKVFNADSFMKLFKKRLDEYGKYYKLTDLVFICYYLEIMNYTTEKLEYYNNEYNIFNEKKLKMIALEEIKWLDNEITKLIKEHIIEKIKNNQNVNNDFVNKTITKEVLLNELELAEKEFNNNSFYIIKEIIKNGINKQYKEIINIINQSDRSSREWIYSVIGNKTGDLLETGKYHAYRGFLDMVGNDLLKIFDKSYDLLIQINAKDIDTEYANEQKETIRKNIKNVG